MYFKKLEIFGFKSFADKTVIEFQPGVTAIVGPNGCGKSNVADSIRWVLGEQSAKSLRGSSMEDIIFNGSSEKEPMNLSQVSLTFSNESRILPIEYDEVTISRRLYRSGESEYLLNGNIVRLKDIHELLLGTGIGTESYSIIEQGKMDAVLASKPEDRRVIFEEAAGITKFKSKKKEALRKLEQTDQNLLRVNDIIQEVKRQIGSIERQAKKAEQYKVEFEKLKTLELSVASREFILFDGERRTHDEQLVAIQEREGQVQAAVEELETRLHEERKALDVVENACRDIREQELRVGSFIRAAEDRALLNRERIGELAERRENLGRQIEQARRRIEEYGVESENLSTEWEMASKEEAEGLAFLQGVENEFQAIDQALNALRADVEAARGGLQDLARRRAQMDTERATVRAERSAFERDIERITREEEAARAEKERTDNEWNSLQGETHGAREEASKAESESVDMENRLTALAQNIRTLDAEKDAESMRLSALNSKIELLKGLEERREGYWGGVKALLDERDRDSQSLPGLVGLLADRVSAHGGFELAIEAALDVYRQAVVFDSDQSALSAAHALRSYQKGRALLLSLEAGQSAAQSLPEAIADRSVLRRMNFEPALQVLLESVLGNVAWAESAEEAFGISRQYPGVLCVTSQGERFDGRRIWAGTFYESPDTSVIGRRGRLEQFESEAGALTARTEQLNRDVSALHEQEDQLKADLRQSQLRRHDAQVRLAELEHRSEVLEERKTKAHEAAAVSAAARAAVDEKLRQQDEAEQIFARQIAEMAAEEQSLNSRLEELNQGTQAQVDRREGLLVRLAETRSKQGLYTARREKIEKDRNWIQESRRNQEELVSSYERELIDANARREALENENTGLEEERARLTAERDQLLVQLEARRGEMEAQAASLDTIERERSEQEAYLKEARESKHRHEMKSAEIGFNIDRLKERIFNAYQVDLAVQEQIAGFEAAAQEALMPGVPESLEEAHAEIQKQREKLNRMGPVNLVAIEEHEELRQRFEFLTKQEQDLVQAKDDLMKAIQKINRTTKELFAETFEKVRQYFVEYYRTLFGGGSADLVLLDEQDILESGIEIVARPPGKKLQSITLLSGGEKALTAVALVFALFRVKPSPFCVLDEIDAPLDETNVDRFCQTLKSFITGSQFILITHNKRTMNLADAMYGVTMAQTGVSRIVSVKFDGRQGSGAREAQAAEEAVA